MLGATKILYISQLTKCCFFIFKKKTNILVKELYVSVRLATFLIGV